MLNDNSPPNKMKLTNKKDILDTSVKQCVQKALDVSLRKNLVEDKTWHGFIDIDDPSQGYFCDIEKIVDIVIDNLIQQCFDATYVAAS